MWINQRNGVGRATVGECRGDEATRPSRTGTWCDRRGSGGGI